MIERRKFGPLGVVHPLRVQPRRPVRLLDVPREAPLQRPDLVAHGAVHGVRRAVRRQDHGLPGPAHVQLLQQVDDPGDARRRLHLPAAGAHSPHPGQLPYTVPDFEQLAQYRAYCGTFPEIDSPEILGPHPNADLTYRQKSAKELIEIVGDTQPKGGGGGDGLSKEDLVSEEAQKQPQPHARGLHRGRLQAGHPSARGLSIPLNMFLYQEIQRLQEVIEKVRNMLKQMQLAIKGEVVMTAELAEGIDAMGGATPRPWVYTVGGTEFSWIIPMMASWFNQLMLIDEQLRTWLANDRPPSY